MIFGRDEFGDAVWEAESGRDRYEVMRCVVVILEVWEHRRWAGLEACRVCVVCRCVGAVVVVVVLATHVEQRTAN